MEKWFENRYYGHSSSYPILVNSGSWYADHDKLKGDLEFENEIVYVYRVRDAFLINKDRYKVGYLILDKVKGQHFLSHYFEEPEGIYGDSGVLVWREWGCIYLTPYSTDFINVFHRNPGAVDEKCIPDDLLQLFPKGTFKEVMKWLVYNNYDYRKKI